VLCVERGGWVVICADLSQVYKFEFSVILLHQSFNLPANLPNPFLISHFSFFISTMGFKPSTPHITHQPPPLPLLPSPQLHNSTSTPSLGAPTSPPTHHHQYRNSVSTSRLPRPGSFLPRRSGGLGACRRRDWVGWVELLSVLGTFVFQ
jgi:hypothetical protein